MIGKKEKPGTIEPEALLGLDQTVEPEMEPVGNARGQEGAVDCI